MLLVRATEYSKRQTEFLSERKEKCGVKDYSHKSSLGNSNFPGMEG